MNGLPLFYAHKIRLGIDRRIEGKNNLACAEPEFFG
jgi:hypothetical protein